MTSLRVNGKITWNTRIINKKRTIPFAPVNYISVNKFIASSMHLMTRSKLLLTTETWCISIMLKIMIYCMAILNITYMLLNLISNISREVSTQNISDSSLKIAMLKASLANA